MNIAIIDADLAHNRDSRFPNLAAMKLSAFYKAQGNKVTLLLDYEYLDDYDKVFICKVFTKSIVPASVFWRANVEIGGTGFYYPEKAPDLPYEIEHILPDYGLYMVWAQNQINVAKDKKRRREQLTYFFDFSIGFLTRGCFRKCWFCVNKHYDKAFSASRITEFYDPSRPKLCFLDDNFFAYPKWRAIIKDVKSLTVPFQFKQGLDERLLTESHVHEIMTWKYVDDLIFAFDSLDDAAVVGEKLRLTYRLYPDFKRRMKFYVFCGADRDTLKDIYSVFARCFILAQYAAIPYVMRYEDCYKGEYAALYAAIASWCNQPQFFKKMTFRQFAKARGMNQKLLSKYMYEPDKYVADGHSKGSTWLALEKAELDFPLLNAFGFFDIAGDMLLSYGNGKKVTADD